MAQRTAPTDWVGWDYFAGAMLLVVGGLQIIAGLVALLRQTFYVVATDMLAFNYAIWGWIHLTLGALLLVAAFGLWTEAAWARPSAILLTVLTMIGNLAFLPAYPLWSLIALTINGFILYALTMHGAEQHK